MIRRRPDPGEWGFTLVELLVAISILGIIMLAIGAMIATAFRTTTTVSDELNASRGPKLVARYWPADVENAQEVLPGAGGCGTGTAVATFKIRSVDDPGGAEAPTRLPDTSDTTVTWAVVDQNGRRQMRRFACGAETGASTVVPDLGAATPTAEPSGSDPGRWVVRVSVPDRSRPSKQFDFEVAGAQQVTTTISVPGP